MSKHRVFISGVAGFLGSHLADSFLQDGHDVVGCDNMIGGYLDNVPAGVEFYQIECNDVGRLKDYMKGVDIVYHCAATAYEGLSVFSPHMITQNIVTASTGMISAAIANNVKRFVMCSSMARYGSNKVPFTEEMTPKPQDPYGIGKYTSELMLQSLAETHPNLRIVVPTTANVADTVEAALASWPLPTIVLRGIAEKYDAFAASDAALAASGTVALELAMAKLPAVITYRINPITHAYVDRVVKVDYANLINVVLNREAVPELLQYDCTPEKLTASVTRLLDDKEAAATQIAAGQEALKVLGYGGVSPALRAADEVLAVIARNEQRG